MLTSAQRLRVLATPRTAASDAEIDARIARIKKTRVGEKRDQAILEMWEALAPMEWQDESCPFRAEGGYILSPRGNNAIQPYGRWPAGLSYSAMKWALTHVREIEHVQMLLRECEARTKTLYAALGHTMIQYEQAPNTRYNITVEWESSHDTPPTMWIYHNSNRHKYGSASQFPWKAAYVVWDKLISIETSLGEDAVEEWESIIRSLNKTVNSPARATVTPDWIRGMSNGFDALLNPETWDRLAPQPSRSRPSYENTERPFTLLRDAVLSGAFQNPFAPLVAILEYGVLPLGIPNKDTRGAFEVVFPESVKSNK